MKRLKAILSVLVWLGLGAAGLAWVCAALFIDIENSSPRQILDSLAFVGAVIINAGLFLIAFRTYVLYAEDRRKEDSEK